MPTVDSFLDFADLLRGMTEAVMDGDYGEALDEIEEDLEEQHRGMYERGMDSNNKAWKPLAPSTVAKKGHGIILVDTRALVNSLTTKAQDSIREKDHLGLTFGTSVEYAGFHETGTKRMPKRPPAGVNKITALKACHHVADAAVRAIEDSI